MRDRDLLQRITIKPDVMAGKPVIKGTRLTVEYILNLLARGATTKEILAAYQGLNIDDIQACFLFAAKSLGDITLNSNRRHFNASKGRIPFTSADVDHIE